MDWFKKHTDAVMVISAIVVSMLWMNGKFNEVEKRFALIDKSFSEIEKEIAVMKAVMLMKQILPPELAHVEVKNAKE